MPVQRIGRGDLEYSLVCFDAAGIERPENGVPFSDSVIGAVVTEPITDVVLFSHGWNGDVPAARDQYQRWLTAMADCAADRAALVERAPEFRPLIVGLHWPSKAWGDEELGGDGSFGTIAGQPPAAALTIDGLVDRYAALLSPTERARDALRTIFDAAMTDISPDAMPDDVAEAYEVLDSETGLGAEGEGAEPGTDRSAFDASAAYRAVQDEEDVIAFGRPALGGILAPLRTLTFWHMKRRACRFGESGAAALLRRLQAAVPPGRTVRFHLMGHSFGCIVVSACVAGRSEDQPAPVDTLVLVQGAMSLWSFCSSIPGSPQRAGYFHRVVADHLVRGVTVTTRSEHDRAVGFFYPLGAAVVRQRSFAAGELPTYGGLGTFGARGPLPAVHDLPMRDVSEPYDFEPRTIYNLEGSAVIADGTGPSGAHSDICHPAVAHAVWSAISISLGTGADRG
jgi:hypothetical protein